MPASYDVHRRKVATGAGSPGHRTGRPRREWNHRRARILRLRRRPPTQAWLQATKRIGRRRQRRRRTWQPLCRRQKLEVFLLALMIDEPDLLIWLSEKSQELEIAPLSGNDFQQIEYREIFSALRRFIASDELWDIRAFQETLSPAYHPVLSQLTTQILAMPEREQGVIQNALLKLLIRLRYARLRESLSAMQFLLHDAQENENREAVLEFSSIINANRRDRHHLEHVMARSIQVTYGVTRVESGIAIA